MPGLGMGGTKEDWHPDLDRRTHEVGTGGSVKLVDLSRDDLLVTKCTKSWTWAAPRPDMEAKIETEGLQACWRLEHQTLVVMSRG